MLSPQQGQQQQQSPLGGSLNLGYGLGNGLFGSGASGAGGLFSGGAGLSTAFSPAFFAALIGLGKNLESNNPRTGFGQALLGGLGPSGNQILKDPIGMGLPTLFGMPFLTPFTASKQAQAAKPEWQKLFPLGS